MTDDIAGTGNTDTRLRRTWNNRMPLVIGGAALAFFAGVIGIWGTQTHITGAVLAKGRVQVSSTQTAVQHPSNGVVAEVLVEDGDKVEAGDVVLRLDDADIRSQLKQVESELFETLANGARLEAIIDGKTELRVDPLLASRATSDNKVAELVERQRNQLRAHYELIETTEASLQEQLRQVANQIRGAQSELSSKKAKLELIGEELERLTKASVKGLAATTQVQKARTDHINTEGEIGKLNAGIAALKGKSVELDLRLRGLVPSTKQQAIDKLTLSQRESGRFLERRNGILNNLANLEVRTPISGSIHDLKVLGLRSVVIAGAPLMYVVPDNNPVTISARVDAGDIDQVTQGQNAMLKFEAFNIRTLPNIYGTVSKVSPDAFLDPRTQKYFYNVEVFMTAAELEKLGENSLISGMPVSVYLSTSSRSPMEYVTRPIAYYIDRAFRDG